MSLDKIYVHINISRNKKGQFYTGVSRTTTPDGSLLSSFEAEFFERIAKSKQVKKVRDEIERIAQCEKETRAWVEHHALRDLFDLYFNAKLYKRGRAVVVPTTTTPRRADPVSAAMDLSNYAADVLGSAIADHTLAQDCAWRRRMHMCNARSANLEIALSATPAPLGRFTTKKRKRAPPKPKSKRMRSTAQSPGKRSAKRQHRVL